MLGFSPISATPLSTLYPYGFQNSASVEESATGQDSISVSGSAFLVQTVDSASGSDLIAATFLPLARIAEIASVDATPAVAPSIFNPSLAVSAFGADSINAYWTTQSDVAEAAAVADAARGIFLPLTAIAETASGADSFSTAFFPLAQVSEAAAGSDAVLVLPSTFGAAIAENAAGLDAIRASGVFFVGVSESSLVSDLFAAAFLWNLIDDAENADWGQIDTAQTASWNQVDSAQETQWQNINNAQSSGWTNVDDSQTPGWQNISTLKGN